MSITIDGSGNYVFTVVFESGTWSMQDTTHFWWSLKSRDSNVLTGGSDKSIVDYTISFGEKINGWTSFKSFIQENGLSLNNKYYTFKAGKLYEHRKNVTRNNFYGAQYDSTINILLNGSPNVPKSLSTIKYSGSQARTTRNVLTGFNTDGNNQFDGEYYNNFAKTGWYIDSIESDLQTGSRLEFKEKEGKWFTSIQGIQTYFNDDADTNLDMKEFSVQGIGYAGQVFCPDCGSSSGGGGGGGTVGYACLDNRTIMTDSNGDNIIFGVGENAPTVSDLNGWFNQSPTHRAYTFVDYAFEYVNYGTIPSTTCNTGNGTNSWYSVVDIGVTIPTNTNGHASGSHSFYTYQDFLNFTGPIIGTNITSWDGVSAALHEIYGYNAFITSLTNPCLCDNSQPPSSSFNLTVKDNPLDH